MVYFDSENRGQVGSYHIRSEAGMKAIREVWNSPFLEVDVDFESEELYILQIYPEQNCEVRTARALQSNGHFLVAELERPQCVYTYPPLAPGPMRAMAYAFARQTLPVLPAKNPELPRIELEPIATYKVATSPPKKLAFTPDGTLVAITYRDNRVFRLGPGGTELPSIQLKGPADDFAMAPTGDLWVVGPSFCARIDPQGGSHDVTLEYSFDSIAIDGKGHLWLQRHDIESMVNLRIYDADGSGPALSVPYEGWLGNPVRALDGSIWDVHYGARHYDDDGQRLDGFPQGAAGGGTIDAGGDIWQPYAVGELVRSSRTGRPIARYGLDASWGRNVTMAFDPAGALWIVTGGTGEVRKYRVPN